MEGSNDGVCVRGRGEGGGDLEGIFDRIFSNTVTHLFLERAKGLVEVAFKADVLVFALTKQLAELGPRQNTWRRLGQILNRLLLNSNAKQAIELDVMFSHISRDFRSHGRQPEHPRPPRYGTLDTLFRA